MVVLIHCIFATDNVTGHSEKDPIWREKMEHIFRYLSQVGMPVFFLISGMGTIYYETEKKGFKKFSINRTKRLFYPFLFSIPIFLLPRLYMSQGWEKIGRVDGGERIEWNIIKWIPLIFKDNLVFKLG